MKSMALSMTKVALRIEELDYSFCFFLRASCFFVSHSYSVVLSVCFFSCCVMVVWLCFVLKSFGLDTKLLSQIELDFVVLKVSL